MSRVLRVALSALFAFGLHAARAQPAPGGPPAVGVVKVERRPVTETSEYVGRIEAINRVALVARVTAFLEKRLFVEGSEVKQGTLLYLLEQPPFQADVEAKQGTVGQIQAQLQNANITLARAQALLNTPAGQRSTVDDALAAQRSQAAQLATAQATLRQSQINLSYTEIRAPIDGRISATNVTEGNVVGPGSGTLATIVSQDPMYVVFPVALRDLLDLRNKYAGKGGFEAIKVRLRLPNNQMYGHDGTLDYVSPTVAVTTDTVTLRATVPNPPLAEHDASGPARERELLDGEFVTAIVEGAQPIQLLTVPRAAVLSDQEGDYVYTVGPDNKAQRTNIRLGQAVGTDTAVLSGLKEGDTVVVDGLQRVHSGAPVSPGPPQASGAAAAAAQVRGAPAQRPDNIPPQGQGNAAPGEGVGSTPGSSRQ